MSTVEIVIHLSADEHDRLQSVADREGADCTVQAEAIVRSNLRGSDLNLGEALMRLSSKNADLKPHIREALSTVLELIRRRDFDCALSDRFPSIEQLSTALGSLPSDVRRLVLLNAFSFLPGAALSESIDQGYFRALLANSWEELFMTVVPITSLRRAFSNVEAAGFSGEIEAVCVAGSNDLYQALSVMLWAIHDRICDGTMRLRVHS